ncbi:unnamed protein product [Rotaria sp. Silwood2]|nr:unnamed protein product [Rotaria sp. Silwood2]CAF3225027.1 unnamed protein product [Rotaria sp. Silwood2]CAF3581486.1 unnamed protein product [Rotaria sp. Silwood2]CAF4617209.1 unnamed protein product [Rotaria sp. Silwood2]CAF4628819.1 unnamed protein product [Rotaria sp. Silwood2]
MTTSRLKFLTTSKGKPLPVCDGYMYTLNNDQRHMKYWRCKDRSCSANIYTDKNDKFKARKGKHDHLPSPEHVELLELNHKVKSRITKESAPIALIYDQELAAAQFSLPALALAPSAKEAQSSLQRLRRQTTSCLPTSCYFGIPD